MKKLTKEDIKQYATEEEKELLEKKKVPPMLKRVWAKKGKKKVKEEIFPDEDRIDGLLEQRYEEGYQDGYEDGASGEPNKFERY